MKSILKLFNYTYMQTLIKEINLHFRTKSNYFEIFSKVDTRVEGWFKAELLLLFENLLKKGKIVSYQRELNIQDIERNRKSIDFEVELKSDGKILIELKAMTISQSAGTPRNLKFYFKEDHVGIYRDFKKLDLVNYSAVKYVIAFIYPKPNLNKWIEVKEKMLEKYANWNCISNIEDYPESYFISIWTSK